MRKYDRLRAEMKRQRVGQYEIGQAIGLKPGAVSAKMVGRSPWTVEEAYKVTHLLGFAPIMMQTLFPAEEYGMTNLQLIKGGAQ